MSAAGWEVRFINIGGGSGRIAPLLRGLATGLRLSSTSRGWYPDFLFMDYSARLQAGPAALVLKRRFRCPLVVTVNAVYFTYRNEPLKDAIDKMWSRTLLRRADMIVTSGFVLNELLVHQLHIPGGRIHCILPGLRPDFVNASVKEDYCLHDPPRLLTVGRLHPIKGLEFLIKAIALLRSQSWPSQLTVVGDTLGVSGYAARLRSLCQSLDVADSVQFADEVGSVEQLIQVYREADLFVLPSLWDTSPAALLEAMVLGLPCVATRSGGAPDFLGQGAAGLIVPPRSAHALADAVVTFLEDTAMRQRLGRAAVNMAATFRNRAWGQVGREYVEILAEL